MNRLLLTCAIGLLSASANAQIGWSLSPLPGVEALQGLAITTGGTVYGVGGFGNNLVKWTGSAWQAVGGITERMYAIDNGGNTVFVGGNILGPNGHRAVGKFDGTNFSLVGEFNGLGGGSITAVAADAAGNVYAGGNLVNANSHMLVCKWNGTTWTEPGGLDGLNALTNNSGVIKAIATDAAGNVYAAGGFHTNLVDHFVAKFNGTSWTRLGSTGFDDEINALAVDAAGNVYAAGDFESINFKHYVAKWNGTSWSPVGTPDFNGEVFALAVVGTTIYAGGDFTNSAGKRYVAKWDGSSWSELGGANSLKASNTIFAIAADAAGRVFAGGRLATTAGQVAVARYGSTAGVENAVDLHALQCAPNFGTGNFHLTGSNFNEEMISVMVTNSLGMVVSENRFQVIQGRLDAALDLADAASGTYFVRVASKDNFSTLMIQKL